MTCTRCERTLMAFIRDVERVVDDALAPFAAAGDLACVRRPDEPAARGPRPHRGGAAGGAEEDGWCG